MGFERDYKLCLFKHIRDFERNVNVHSLLGYFIFLGMARDAHKGAGIERILLNNNDLLFFLRSD
ncbi:MAG TPA: hypothetical protein DGA22_16030 [Acidobacterium sp.]|nr:hypothetical protein [Acidobacterium sp.]